MSVADTASRGVVGGDLYGWVMNNQDDDAEGPGKPPDPDAPDPAESSEAAEAAQLVSAVRAEAVLIAAAQARQLRHIAAFATASQTQLRAAASTWPTPVPFEERDVEAEAEAEVALALGITPWHAAHLVARAHQLTQVMPTVLDALEGGRLDWSRTRTLAEATDALPDPQARRVAAILLTTLDTEDTAATTRAATASADPRGAATDDQTGPTPPLRGPWDACKPATWRRRVTRAVLGTGGPPAPCPQQAAAGPRTWIRLDQYDPTRATFTLEASLSDITWLDQVLDDLATTQPRTDTAGRTRPIGERKGAAVLAVFEAIHDHQPLPAGTGAGGAGRRELGVVLHADTLLEHGPAANDPGQLRGHGEPLPLPPAAARTQARTMLARGAGTTVLLTDHTGALQRLLRLGPAPTGGWTHESLLAAGRAALGTAPPLHTDRYTPSTAIAEHVRAAYPTCTAPTCTRTSTGCDLDHDIPWPHGPPPLRT